MYIRLAGLRVFDYDFLSLPFGNPSIGDFWCCCASRNVSVNCMLTVRDQVTINQEELVNYK